MFDKAMMAALKADGEKLRDLTGEDHGPVFDYTLMLRCDYCTDGWDTDTGLRCRHCDHGMVEVEHVPLTEDDFDECFGPV